MAQIDLRVHTLNGKGKHSIVDYYFKALDNYGALVLSDVYPNTTKDYDSYERTTKTIQDLIRVGFEPKIPIIVGIEFEWPAWLVGLSGVKTLIFGSKAIQQVLDLERYRSPRNVDEKGAIYELVEDDAIVTDLETVKQLRLVKINNGSSFIQVYDDRKQKWVRSKTPPDKVTPDLLGDSREEKVKYQQPTGETRKSILWKYQQALTTEIVEEDLNFKSQGSIESALVLCFNYSDVHVLENFSELNSNFVELLDGIDITIAGKRVKNNSADYNQLAFEIAKENNLLPVITSNSHQVEVYGQNKFISDFEQDIKSEEDLVGAILDRIISNKHMEFVTKFLEEGETKDTNETGLVHNFGDSDSYE